MIEGALVNVNDTEDNIEFVANNNTITIPTSHIQQQYALRGTYGSVYVCT